MLQFNEHKVSNTQTYMIVVLLFGHAIASLSNWKATFCDYILYSIIAISLQSVRSCGLLIKCPTLSYLLWSYFPGILLNFGKFLICSISLILTIVGFFVPGNLTGDNNHNFIWGKFSCLVSQCYDTFNGINFIWFWPAQEIKYVWLM